MFVGVIKLVGEGAHYLCTQETHNSS